MLRWLILGHIRLWSRILFSFKGRIGRKTFWHGLLACAALAWLLSYRVLPDKTLVDSLAGYDPKMTGYIFVGLIPTWYWGALLVLAIISLAVLTKRWHDQDKSGWYSLLIFVPLLGPWIVLVMAGTLPGTPGPNRFAEAPMA